MREATSEVVPDGPFMGVPGARGALSNPFILDFYSSFNDQPQTSAPRQLERVIKWKGYRAISIISAQPWYSRDSLCYGVGACMAYITAKEKLVGLNF